MRWDGVEVASMEDLRSRSHVFIFVPESLLLVKEAQRVAAPISTPSAPRSIRSTRPPSATSSSWCASAMRSSRP